MLLLFYTDFDLTDIDSVSIEFEDPKLSDSITPKNYSIIYKHFHYLDGLWQFELADSLDVDYWNYTIKLINDSVTKEYYLTDIELGMWGTYTEFNPDAYMWVVESYRINGNLYRDKQIYLADTAIFNSLHTWQK